MNTLVIGVSIAVLALAGWEWHWRTKDYPIAPDDNKHLWAHHRHKLEKEGPDGIVMIGSSRVLFDIQLDEWEQETGIRPIMLAAAGTSPIPVFADIVKNTAFRGTLLVGYTGPLYFSPPTNDNFFYQRVNNWVEFSKRRTYADRLNHFLSLLPQQMFAFLNATEEDSNTELDLKTLIDQIPMPKRIFDPPSLPQFAYIDKDRNTTMLDKTVTDTAFVRQITNFWEFAIQPPPNLPPPEVIENMKNGIIEMTVGWVKQFQKRGGKVIFVRCPSQNVFRMAENGGFPRSEYWDKLIEATGATGYHFEDYPFMDKYILPEWSHLATPDAKQFTIDLVHQMQQDGVL